MGRIRARRHVYLGTRVRDLPKKGRLDRASEFIRIAKAIYRDWRSGRISWKKAQGRLLLLYRLTYKKYNSNLAIKQSTAKKLRDYINHLRSQVRKRR